MATTWASRPNNLPLLVTLSQYYVAKIVSYLISFFTTYVYQVTCESETHRHTDTYLKKERKIFSIFGQFL